MLEQSNHKTPLGSLGRILIAANVRGELDLANCLVAPGTGRVGDLVVGRVLPRPGSEITIIDHHLNAHRISEPVRVVAVLGPRDSSTHLCATIPSAGLDVTEGKLIHWVAGESGTVGCLEREAPETSIHDAETSVDFRCDGLVMNSQGQVINIREFVVEPRTSRVSVPILMIAATSAESGKTVLAGELIRQISGKGIRVGGLKVTGTGGVLDSLHHRHSGAFAVLDSVNAGLITTHGEPAEISENIPLIFRQMEDLGADLIVAELGGDLLGANNPEIFRISELMNQVVMLVVISNDALAAAGVNSLNERRFGFPGERVRHFTSPFRNHAGMARRMANGGISVCYDPRSTADIELIAKQVIDEVTKTPQA